MTCLAVAAWVLHPVAGLITTGLLLVLIGYAIEDVQVVVQLRRITSPIVAWRETRRTERKDSAQGG